MYTLSLFLDWPRSSYLGSFTSSFQNNSKLLLREKTEGEIIEFETSLQNGRPVYEFDVFEKDQGIEIEYEIDGVTGLFLESEIELFEIGEDKR